MKNTDLRSSQGWAGTDLKWEDVVGPAEGPLAKAGRWTFWEHPTQGDEGPVLAITMDVIGDHGPIVWDTGDYDVPDYL